MLHSLRRLGALATVAAAEVRRHSGEAKADSGKGIGAQCLEILRLRWGVGKLAPDEYYQYQLYDDRQFTWAEKRKFLGRSLENGLIPYLKVEGWVALANDKLVAEAFLRGLGFPTPTIQAVYHSSRTYGAVPVLRDRVQLANFLRHEARYPCIAKPVWGMYGRDVLALEGYDAQRDVLQLTSGEAIAATAFADRFQAHLGAGMMLQTRLRPHPLIAERCGERICSVRMVAVVDSDGARLVSTLWKIATGTHAADNYWGAGNLIAPVDPHTGVVGRVTAGLGRAIKIVDRHPDTGEPLTGLVLPDWPAAVDMCLKAAASLPGIPFQSWDIALTTMGPTIIEVNINGGMRLPQLVRRAGLYDGDLKALLTRHGYPPR